MLCCSESAYCIRFEVYCGKRQTQDGSTPPDTKSGPAAVVRSLRQVFGPTGPPEFRLIVTDRFYTSVVIAMQLLTMNFYSVGTVMTNKKGLCTANLPKKKKNGRKESNKSELMCPRYSLQLARHYKKYYKSLFLGLIDIAIINAFITYNARRIIDGKSKVSHVSFLKLLHLELCQLQPSDWDQLLRHHGLQPTPTKANTATTAHVPVQTDEWKKGNGGETRKRRQRACKVCSVLKRADQARGGETTFYCAPYKLKTSSKHALASRVFLCNKVKHTSNGVATSCFEIWHKYWKDGTLIPQARRKRKLCALKPARVAVDDESGGCDSGGQSSDDSAAVAPPPRRQRTPAIDDSGTV
ncbi:uncharacterized protein IUM83_04878 [Phytophthora cinnamomi]|uniref:uncharacterized protein n=1 Tax=Phytophthora cinnamomi TaxID=4785 RepID=UPI0035595956|nr:hypothetical protein IUM83_04878 [Phytophthora cinnamomi]